MSILSKIKAHLFGLKYGMEWNLTNSIIPNMYSHTLRLFFLRKMGAKIGENVKMYKGFSIRNPRGLTIQNGVSIGPKVLMDARMGLTICKGAVIAYDAIIWTMNHDYNDISFKPKGSQVIIGQHAWVCSRSIILPGVKIGEGAIVASGAIVNKDVDAYTIVGGIPAKVIGYRENKDYAYDYNSKNDYTHLI